ncbi:histidine phosphatase family protein [Bdellovibrio sp. BCCA]|uniref:histidine phosphatase family protein n=1 Tax=Bdellovibrio sp. BCCA TaxID=3136281 RepID=UPI0030F24B10
MRRKIFLVRHAKSEGNLVIHTCHSEGVDYPESFRNHVDRETRVLLPEAESQINEMATKLLSILDNGVRILTSDYARTQETIQLAGVAMGREISFTVDPLLNERNWGIYEQLPLSEKNSLRRKKEADPFGVIIPNGESLNQVKSRFTTLQLKYAHVPIVLAFTHQEFIIAAICEWLDITTEQFKQMNLYVDTPNCCIVEMCENVIGVRNVKIHSDGVAKVIAPSSHDPNSYQHYENMAEIFRSELAQILAKKVA